MIMPMRLSVLLTMAVLSCVTANSAEAQTSNRVDAEQKSPPQYTSKQLRLYALAMLKIQKVKQALAVRMESANDTQKPVLQAQARDENRAILQRYSLDAATFNQMTNAVDTRPKVRGQVRQTVMQQTLALWK
jgi:hypothetical protein